MEPKQMLEAVIEKAKGKGFVSNKSEWKYSTKGLEDDEMEYLCRNFGTAMLFDHNFAKAYFGEEKTCERCGQKFVISKSGRDWWCPSEFCDETMDEPAWVYHLKEAVLSEDPLLYYYQYLE